MSWNRVIALAAPLFVGAAVLFWSCEQPAGSGDVNAKLMVVDGAPEQAVAVPDLEANPELDPLKVTVDNVGLASFMGEDSMEVVLEDLYTYFHLSNVGEWDAMFEHFPGHRTADTAMLTVQKEMMDKWFHKGLRNRAGGCHIRYVSPWVEEEDQRVALLGLDLNYYLDFFENFEGNPEGMRLTLQDQYGKEAIEYYEFDQIENGDTALMRQFEVNATSSMYVLSSLDSLHCMFLPPQISKSPQLAAEMMDNETMLELLRHKREHFDKK
ncbi:MAG: hypothetical protein P8H88_02805 [Flavobacteriales bacterium]|nr:hypothetical protein [Flavobacteriales bacterium]